MKGLVALTAAGIATLTAWGASAATYDISIGRTTIDVLGEPSPAMAINGTVPGPILRFKEGEDLVINVANTLDEDTSIHWHGLILPSSEDGVPGLSFDGIKPGTTHTYNFPAQQSGTYWYHSHSGLQEQEGVYGAIVIEPKAREPFRYDRDYVVMLSEAHPTSPYQMLANVKKQADYYNYGQRTVGTFFDDIAEKGFGATLSDRLAWGGMRMTPTDIADTSGYTFLINGRNPDQNWSGLFKPGERVRLRFINAGAMTYFDVRIPGLDMTVVQADGNNVQPVKVDELRIAVAETYDVIVTPKEDRAYTIFAQSMDRSGFARATLAPREGMAAEIPPLSPRPQLTMADMAHGDMAGMDHGGMPDMKGMDHGAMDHGAMGGDMAGMDHSQMAASVQDPFYAPGSGLTPKAANGGKVLSYADLKAQKPLYALREPTREIEIRLTGNMERYIWSINGKTYSEADPIRLQYGERVRFKFVNETMMSHPMHLHGMWSILDNGNGAWNPLKHVLNVAPGTTLAAEVEVDAPGNWAFHCHLMFHMATGMFREVIVEGGPQTAAMDMTANTTAHAVQGGK
jgi:L-ascorbate oxidase